MSSALNQVRGLSGISSLRAAQRCRYTYRKNPYSDKLSLIHHHNDLLRHKPHGIRRSFHSLSSRAFKSQVAQIDEEQDENHAETQKPSLYHLQNPPDPENLHPKHTQQPASRSSKKTPKYQPTPSDYLSESLRSAGHALGSSGIPPRTTIHLDDVLPRKVFQKHANPGPHFVRQSLQTTLGEYIRQVEPLFQGQAEGDESNALNIALKDVFRKSSRRYLTTRGYGAEDVAAWAWILTSNDSHQAVSRIFALEADYRTRAGCVDGPRVPPFITLFLLKERYLDPHTLRLLLIHSLHLMSGESLPSINDLENPLETNQDRLTEGPNTRLPKVDVTTCAMLTVRLIRHARQVWPEAFPVIARQFSRFLTRSNLNEAGKSTSDRAKIHRFKTQKYNECLWEFSLPTKTHPFRSAFIQQQAQFELLRAMASNKPVLPVTRTGYRAVVAVQLAHKKTTAERQSADLKAPSWPPWKEERLGMDAQRGNEGLHSRAMNVLSQMKEAGYSPQLWEEISAILAGWDSDGSPTVQTRALASRRPLSLKISLDRNRELVWAARIRATRTVREAWACFLSYQDQGLPLKAVIYAAMAEKLIFRHKAANSHFDLTSHALPGDGREVYPEPASARDIIYVRTEPPTLDDFLDGMISQGFRPSGKLLSLLLQSAPNFSSGLAYLQCSNLTEDQIIALCTVWHQPSEYQAHRKALEALPDFVFGSFIQFLCRHSRTTVATYARDVFMADRLPERIVDDQYNEPLANLSEYQEPEWQTGHPMALWHAIQLVKLRQPPCRWAWHNLLSTFSRDPIQGFHRAYDKWLVRILAWHGMLHLLNWMRARKIELGPKDFQPLCVSFYKAVDAGIQQPSKAEKAFKLYQTATKAPEVEGRDEFDTLIEDGLLLLKTHFDQLVLPSARTSGVAEKSIFGMNNKSESPLEMPTVLHVPSYATLHSFVRAMGIVGDDDGLLHLLRWMSQSAELLNELAEERLNGERMMRQTLVAIRLYLEKLHPQSVNGDRIASDCKVQEAYDIVSRTLGWEWPSNAEIEEYLLYNTVTFT